MDPWKSSVVVNVTAEWASWFSGLVDGEGCFIIYRVGGKYHSASFIINMRADDRPMLEEIKRTLGFGAVHRRRRQRTGNDTHAYHVSGAKKMLALVRLFDQYPLRSRKRRDYEVWRTFVLLHASPKNATDPRLAELFDEIKQARRFEERVG